MASLLDSVNQRTQLVGQNRLELLLFRLQGRQRYGINVFKVREVLQCPRLSALPHQNPHICGIAHIRGQNLPVIDLSAAIGGPATSSRENCFIITTEYNRSVQGFLVSGVDHIVNLNWESVMPPPKSSGRSNYLTAVTELDGSLVEILDVEKVLDEITPADTQVSEKVSSKIVMPSAERRTVLVADDSSVARRQVKRALEPLGLDIILAEDGKEAMDKLLEMSDGVERITDRVQLVISDIEMPEMDGYTLTAEIRSRPQLSDLPVVLHTSLSGVFNQIMVDKVGADKFIAKFDADELVKEVSNFLVEEEAPCL